MQIILLPLLLLLVVASVAGVYLRRKKNPEDDRSVSGLAQPGLKHVLYLWVATYVVGVLPNPLTALHALVMGWGFLPLSFGEYILGSGYDSPVRSHPLIVISAYYVLISALHFGVLYFRKWRIFVILALVLIVSAAGCAETCRGLLR